MANRHPHWWRQIRRISRPVRSWSNMRIYGGHGDFLALGTALESWWCAASNPSRVRYHTVPRDLGCQKVMRSLVLDFHGEVRIRVGFQPRWKTIQVTYSTYSSDMEPVQMYAMTKGPIFTFPLWLRQELQLFKHVNGVIAGHCSTSLDGGLFTRNYKVSTGRFWKVVSRATRFP